MLDMGFIRDVRRIVAKLPAQSARRCCSPPPCRADIRGWPRSMLQRPGARRSDAGRHDGRARRAARASSSRRPTSAQLLQHLLDGHGHRRGRWSSPAPSTAPTRWREQLRRGRHRAPRRSTATRRRTRASGRSATSAAASSACWWRPTSPPAASTSTASRTSINFDLPNVPESYVHRIGRTAPRRRRRHRDLVLRRRGARVPARHRKDHPAAGRGRHRSSVPCRAHRGRRAPWRLRCRRPARPRRNRGKPQRHEGSAADRGSHPERAGRSHGQHRGRHANGEHPHGRDMRRPDAGQEGRHRESNGHRPHAGSQGAEPREHSHGRDARRPDAGTDGGGRHRGSNGQRQHAHGAEPREQGHRQGQRHEPRKSADGGHKAPGQRPQGKQHARQDNGGQQPLKRAQPGGRSQRLEPVRMR